MGEWRRAEFIDGEVFLQPPSMVRHLDASGNLFVLLSIYVDRREIGWTGSNALICLTRNDYRPDVVFYGPKKASSLQTDQIKLPAPDFVAEVLSPGTERHDRGVKFEVRRAWG